MREVFRTASQHLRRLVPFDAAVWAATDPATGLPTAPTRAENVAREVVKLYREDKLFSVVPLQLARTETALD